MKFTSLWKMLPTVVVALLLTACSSGPVAPEPPPRLEFNVTPDHQTNNNNLLYFVVRSANEKQFMLESYQEVASKAFSNPPDPQTLGVFSIVPGQEQQYTLEQPAKGAIALYFLFTEPGSQWKKLLSMPLKTKYSIHLKANSHVKILEDEGGILGF